MNVVSVLYWLIVFAAAARLGWSVAGFLIQRHRRIEADQYGLMFGNDGTLRRQFLDNPDTWDRF